MLKVKKDCFAYNSDKNRCEALNAKYCATNPICNFYKPKEQVKDEREKGKKR